LGIALTGFCGAVQSVGRKMINSTAIKAYSRNTHHWKSGASEPVEQGMGGILLTAGLVAIK
jgi:hypothetical protein